MRWGERQTITLRLSDNKGGMRVRLQRSATKVHGSEKARRQGWQRRNLSISDFRQQWPRTWHTGSPLLTSKKSVGMLESDKPRFGGAAMAVNGCGRLSLGGGRAHPIAANVLSWWYL